jgi:hypothetical protein
MAAQIAIGVDGMTPDLSGAASVVGEAVPHPPADAGRPKNRPGTDTEGGRASSRQAIRTLQTRPKRIEVDR